MTIITVISILSAVVSIAFNFRGLFQERKGKKREVLHNLHLLLSSISSCEFAFKSQTLNLDLIERDLSRYEIDCSWIEQSRGLICDSESSLKSIRESAEYCYDKIDKISEEPILFENVRYQSERVLKDLNDVLKLTQDSFSPLIKRLEDISRAASSDT